MSLKNFSITTISIVFHRMDEVQCIKLIGRGAIIIVAKINICMHISNYFSTSRLIEPTRKVDNALNTFFLKSVHSQK